ncbi:FG-GAP-like repeat-containing protein [Marivirga tractuosa]|uniref:FG-GAP-like repeat-containing protein n=1 Tax=Marivirga tractuosa TaxID=1006 RepID=UPI0035CE8726
MKTLNILLLLLLSSVSAIAQINFKQILPPAPAPQVLPVFESVEEGSIAYADVDGVNGLDVIVTGSNSAGDPIAKLYINDGTGNYTEKTGTPFVGVKESSVAFADVDDNGTQDVFISGYDGTNPTSKLYLNDGNGNFTDSGISNILGVRESAIAIADVDGENGSDILVTGRSGAGSLKTVLYINDGTGNFSEVDAANTSEFADVNKGAVAFADIDGNGTQDLVITGFSAALDNPPVTEIHLNDGNADFTKLTGSTFENVRDSDVAFADVDGNNTIDLLISGFNDSGDPITKLYINDGNANFTDATSTFDGLGYSTVSFADVDNQNGPDILITGSINSGSNSPVSKLYINDGTGNFTEETGTPFINVSRGDVSFLDINGNTSLDLVISGRNNTSTPVTEVYVNNGSGAFNLATGTPFEGVYKSASAFADVDNDGNQDVIITGEFNTSTEIAKLYSNDGSGIFTEVSGTPFTGVETSAIAYADVDGQNGLDVLISGYKNNSLPLAEQYSTTLYTQNTNGDFEDSGESFPGLAFGSIAFADIDDDNDQDLVITGANFNESVFYSTNLYTNNGDGTFTDVTGAPFEDVVNSSIAFADMDGENGPDLIISGNSASGDITELYLNNGSGGFSPSGQTFDGVSNGAIAVGDTDGDGSLDLLVTGNNIAKLYTNDGTVGNPTFSEVTGTPFEGVTNSAAKIADIDGVDGNDIIISGENSSGEYITKLYINDGSGNFSEVLDLPFDGVFQGDISLSDVDGDGLIDILLTGRNNSNNNISKLYRNITDFVPPTITSPATASVDENLTSSFYTATADEDVTFSLGNTKDEAFFEISIDALSFKTGPDFETPQDANSDNVYLVDLIATDEAGNEVTQEVAVTVLDVDEDGPTITSPATESVEENVTGTVYTATADVSATFSLGSSKDEALFNISTDAISLKSAPNFEIPEDANEDNVYELDLIATDGDGFTTTKAITITVTDLDEIAPVITSDAAVSIAENVTGTVYTATADETVTFNLGNSKDEALFNLSTDEISFNNSPDFETPLDANEDNIYELDITATDEAGNTTTKAISITVTDVDEPGPVITSPASETIEENVTGTVYTATADVSATFSLGDNKDEALFDLSTDAISFKSAPDFETPLDANEDNVYELDLIATDGDGLSTTKAISITVTDVDEPGPVITSPASETVEENVTGTVYTATADVSVTFSLGDSKDEAIFDLSTDAISFKSAPDFETPLDANEDNVYELDLIATDADGLSTTKAISITVTDVDEPGPVITSPASETVEENITGTVYSATADVSVTFSLGDSKDEALFDLSTDAISFKSAPDFETPLDANEDNVYELDLIATDGDGLSTTKAISITVTDVEEEPLSTDDEILSKIYPNPVKHTLFIEAVNMAKGTSIHIMDISGRLQKTIQYNGQEQGIDVSDLKAGFYLLKIHTNDKQLQLKFMKE